MKVIGIGEKKTLNAFITACDKFIYFEILKPQIAHSEENGTKKVSKSTTATKEEPLSKMNPRILKLFSDSISDLADENGWIFLGELGNLMLK